MDLLAQIDDQTIHLAIMDPPYNMRKAAWDTFPSHTHFMRFTTAWLDRLLPKLTAHGSLYVFNTPYNCAFILPHLVARGMRFQNWITWDKRDGLGAAKRKYSNGQETILFFTKSDRHVFNYDSIRLPYDSTARMAHARTKGILKNGKRWFPNPKGKHCGEVWHISSERHVAKVNGKVQKLPHLTPKPRALIARIIRASSNEGDLVLDCFAGSGTTAVVAKQLGRNFICGDQEPEFVALAQKNLQQHA